MSVIEDKLRASERIRLEALAQAITASGAPMGRQQAAGDILKRAAAFEKFIITGEVN